MSILIDRFAPDLDLKRVLGMPRVGDRLSCPRGGPGMRPIYLFREACYRCALHGFWFDSAAALERLLRLAADRYAERGSPPRPPRDGGLEKRVRRIVR
jgi:hypothetical protein